MHAPNTTWDGLPASEEKPLGAAVVVYRKHGDSLELLLLHRAHKGPDYGADWAWTPPSGCRFPDEPIDVCARRELQEEAGLDLPMIDTHHRDDAWVVYVAEAPPDVTVKLIDKEHDRYAWVPAAEALETCRPEEMRTELQTALAFIRNTNS
jgi:8-oxo-dGTP pyrophosphatase MutT (NUDIX family)